MRERAVYAFLLNLFLVVSEATTLLGVMRERGPLYFSYYTENANTVALFASLIFCIAILVGRGRVPRWVRLLRYLSVFMLSVVVLVLLLVLSPLLGGVGGARILFFDGTMYFHHLFCPMLSALSFFLFEEGAPLTRREALLALVPTALYAAVLFILNALSVVSGPYPFFMVHDMPLWLILALAALLLSLTLALAALLRWVQKMAAPG